MDALALLWFDRGMTNEINEIHSPALPDPGLGPLVRRTVARRSFACLATTSADRRPHAAGVLYQLADGDLWISTLRASRKARNVAATGWAAVSIPARRIPVGPPSTVQLQGRAQLLDLDDPELRRLAAAGRLGRVTGHGELELDGGCFIRITPPRRVPLFGLGMSRLTLARDPLSCGRIAEVDWADQPQ
jgi:hypothetical protein